LPCSSVYAILLPMKDSRTAVFPHEGTSTLPVHAHVRRTKSLQATRDGGSSSAIAEDVISPACLSSGR
jgi:hypothetical protein